MSTKIHTLVDALGNPVSFFLTGGQAHDLAGADHLLPLMQADMLIADKAFDADARAIATRYDKTARNFLAAIHLIATAIWRN